MHCYRASLAVTLIKLVLSMLLTAVLYGNEAIHIHTYTILNSLLNALKYAV